MSKNFVYEKYVREEAIEFIIDHDMWFYMNEEGGAERLAEMLRDGFCGYGLYKDEELKKLVAKLKKRGK